MDKPHLLQLGPYGATDQDALDAAFTVHRLDLADDPAALLARVGPDVRAIATDGGRGCDGALMAACPRLEIIAINGVGYDAVDLAAARAAGVTVTNTPDVLTGDVADLALALLLGHVRQVPQADAFVRAGRWPGGSFPLTRSLGSMRAGVLGLGRIGRAIAGRCAAFGMPVAYSGRTPKETPGWTFHADPVDLAHDSDVLFVALAASDETRGIVGRGVIEALGPQGLLVNVSRGSTVDEGVLLDALGDGRLGGAALDVFRGEPDIDARFLALPNVLLQPHMGSGTHRTRAAMGKLMRDNLTAHFAGRPVPTPVESE